MLWDGPYCDWLKKLYTGQKIERVAVELIITTNFTGNQRCKFEQNADSSCHCLYSGAIHLDSLPIPRVNSVQIQCFLLRIASILCKFRIKSESTQLLSWFVPHLVRDQPSSLISTGCVVPLRGDWAIFCHATLAQDGMAECDKPGKHPLKYSVMAGNWTRAGQIVGFLYFPAELSWLLTNWPQFIFGHADSGRVSRVW